MIGRHVDRRLAALADGRLEPADRVAVERHLDACPRCRRRRAALEKARGALLAAGPAVFDEEMPAAAVERTARALREALRSGVAGRSGRPTIASPRGRWPVRLAAALAGAAALAAIFVLSMRSPGVWIEPVTGDLGTLERAALTAWRDLARDGFALDFETAAPAIASEWLAARGLGARLATERPVEDGDRFVLVGTRDLSTRGMRAAAVVYRIDDRPAVLVVSSAADAQAPPRWGLAGKRIRYAQPSGGPKLLTWSHAGKSYTLASQLPGLGQQACLMCHTDRARRAIVARLADRL